MPGPGRQVARNTVLNLLGQALPLVVGLFALPVIVRGLGVERLGLLGLGWVVLGYFSLLDLGMGRAATRFASAALGRGARQEVAGIIWSAVLVQSLLGVAGALLLTTATPFLVNDVLHASPELAPDALATFRVLALAIPVVLVSASFRGGLEAAQRFDLVNAVSAPGSALNFLLPMGAVLAGWDLPRILWLLVGARAVTTVAYFALCIVQFPELLHAGRPSRATLRMLMPFGLWTTISNVVSPVLDQLDRFLLAAFAGLTSVGYYTAPQEIAVRIRILPTAMAQALFPQFAAGGGDDAARLSRYYALAVRSLAVGLTPVTVAMVFMAPDLLRIWLGPSIGREGSTALQWLAVGVLLNAVAYIPVAYLHGVNRPDLPAKFHLLEVPGFLILSALLMPRWGAAGAGAGWAIRASADATLLLFAASRLGATRGTRLVSPAAFAWSALVATTLVLGFVTSGSDLGPATRSVMALLSSLVVLATAWLGVLDPEDRAHLMGALSVIPGLGALAGAPRWTVFLDRDGVLNRKAASNDYVKRWAEFAWLPGALAAITRLHHAGVRVVIVTNQQGVAKGLIRPADLEDIHTRLRADVERAGGRIAGIYVCPHLDGTCDCRKPAPGLFHQARRDLPEIDFSRSVVVGDSVSDVEAGVRIGARVIRVHAEGDGHARSLADAVDRFILPWLKK